MIEQTSAKQGHLALYFLPNEKVNNDLLTRIVRIAYKILASCILYISKKFCRKGVIQPTANFGTPDIVSKYFNKLEPSKALQKLVNEEQLQLKSPILTVPVGGIGGICVGSAFEFLRDHIYKEEHNWERGAPFEAVALHGLYRALYVNHSKADQKLIGFFEKYFQGEKGDFKALQPTEMGWKIFHFVENFNGEGSLKNAFIKEFGEFGEIGPAVFDTLVEIDALYCNSYQNLATDVYRTLGKVCGLQVEREQVEGDGAYLIQYKGHVAVLIKKGADTKLFDPNKGLKGAGEWDKREILCTYRVTKK